MQIAAGDFGLSISDLRFWFAAFVKPFALCGYRLKELLTAKIAKNSRKGREENLAGFIPRGGGRRG
jgi:hypothetical protein